MGAALRPDGAYDYAPKGVMRDLEVVESKISEGLDLKYWKAVRQQLLMCIEEPNIPNFTLKRIHAPTLVMAGDRDLIIDTHTLEIFNALPNAQLCIFPGATHAMPVEDPLTFNAVMERFFRNPFSRPESRDFFKDPDFPLSGPER
jgi:pimeloyl-ACP methyl ester carboxylesterase